MEFRYDLKNITPNIHLPHFTEQYFIVQNNQIIDSSKDILSICIGKEPRNFLEQLYIWGKTFEVKVTLVGILGIFDLLHTLEEHLDEWIIKPEERMWVKLLYPDGHFGYIEYNGTNEDRFRIIKEHTDLFGSGKKAFDYSDRNVNLPTVKDYLNLDKKTNKNNKFEIKI